MQFLSKLLTAVGVVLVAVAVVTAQAAGEQDIVNAVEAVTFKAYNLQIVVSELNKTSVKTVGKGLSGDIEDISGACEEYTSQIQNDDPTPLSESASKEVITVSTGMCESFQSLLQSLEDQHSLLDHHSLARPLYHDLGELQERFDTFVTVYSPYIPSQANELQSMMSGVTAAFADTLRVYKH